ncbi:uncharacterized protein LOC113235835 isoform X2 [Hyposmocoma kahamanoa]|uniref:uncharacterized protein LOC113235835 isoform X2 n=1 Tax=Hyposmocoma kahamanoa TaxID=1477025 RepID=UPI000E6D6B5B|nr:uncharacterized protein LOC113235835 isoform X2 [Hyposmocoma kahamanoa]
METFWNPVIYFSSLLVCMCLGNVYKRINSTETKRNYGTGVGLLVVCLICGSHILHTIFLVLGNAIVIRCCDKSYVHRISLLYTFFLLLYFQLNVKESVYELWIFQVLTLRMVGMAFEVNLAYKSKVAKEALKKAIPEPTEMKISVNPSRESSISVTPVETATKKARESLSTKAGLKVPSDTNKEESATESPSAVQRNAPVARSANDRLSPGNVLSQADKTARRFSESVAAADKAVKSLNERMSITPENRKEIANVQNNDIAVSKIPLTNSVLELDVMYKDPTAVDIISYAYFFIGLHKGPYYRWKIFDDHFYNSFGVLGDCRIITEHKLKKAIICGCAYILLRIKYDPNIYFQSQFYELYDTDFRYLYSVPHLIMYFLKHQIVMLLCTSVCTETGFGVYPAKTQPVPGHGPTMSLGLLKMASAFTFLCWTVWLSPTIPQFIMSITLWIYMHLEEEFQGLYDTTGSLKLSWSMGFSIMRMMCLVYLTPCLVIDDARSVLRYYNSINWIYHVVLLSLMVYAVAVAKFRASNVV